MTSKFFAFMARMKYIRRWGLMHCGIEENVAEHSLQVSMIAHDLALVDRVVCGGNADPLLAGMIAVYHETGEVITGDLPTPIKYFNNEITDAYKGIERIAEDKLLETLPEDLISHMRELVQPDSDSVEYRLVKCADKIAAYIKALEEMRRGNSEFSSAVVALRSAVECMTEPSVKYFVATFLPAFELTIDELNR